MNRPLQISCAFATSMDMSERGATCHEEAKEALEG